MRSQQEFERQSDPDGYRYPVAASWLVLILEPGLARGRVEERMRRTLDGDVTDFPVDSNDTRKKDLALQPGGHRS